MAFLLHIYKARCENLKVKYYRLPKPHQLGLTYPLQVLLVPWSKSLVSAMLEMSQIPKHIAHDPASAPPKPVLSCTHARSRLFSLLLPWGYYTSCMFKDRETSLFPWSPDLLLLLTKLSFCIAHSYSFPVFTYPPLEHRPLWNKKGTLVISFKSGDLIPELRQIVAK